MIASHLQPSAASGVRGRVTDGGDDATRRDRGLRSRGGGGVARNNSCGCRRSKGSAIKATLRIPASIRRQCPTAAAAHRQ